jgi:hypothetical protein
LLQQERITLIQYLEWLPNGYISNKTKLINELKAIAQATVNPEEEEMPDQQALEREAQFFDSLPFEIRQQLQQMPPEQMEVEIQRMMTGAPIQ